MLAKKIEAVSVKILVACMGLVTAICALIFFVLSEFNEGIVCTADKCDPLTIFDAAYFSVVTISSLGYGDYKPIGLGRLVATIEVVSGLVLLAIIVSKLASDRTSTYVRLLYTSDCERRLKDFQYDINARVAALKEAQRNHSHDEKQREIKSLGLIAVNLATYYQFQVRVGALGEEWAKKNSLRIARAITQASEQIGLVGKAELVNTAERQVIKETFNHITRVITTICENQAAADFSAYQKQINTTIESYERYYREGRTTKIPSEITPYIVEKVKLALPPRPWAKNVHVDVARKLRISNRLSHRVISRIEEENQPAVPIQTISLIHKRTYIFAGLGKRKINLTGALRNSRKTKDPRFRSHS